MPESCYYLLKFGNLKLSYFWTMLDERIKLPIFSLSYLVIGVGAVACPDINIQETG